MHQVGKAGHVGAPGSHARPHGHVSAGKTVQSIALILANRADPVTGGTCVAPPRDYVSDGCVAVLKTAHKAAEKAAKKAATAAAKAAKKAAGGSKGGEPRSDEAVAAAAAAEAPASGTLADVLIAPPSPHAPPELVAAAAPFVAAWKRAVQDDAPCVVLMHKASPKFGVRLVPLATFLDWLWEQMSDKDVARAEAIERSVWERGGVRCYVNHSSQAAYAISRARLWEAIHDAEQDL